MLVQEGLGFLRSGSSAIAKASRQSALARRLGRRYFCEMRECQSKSKRMDFAGAKEKPIVKKKTMRPSLTISTSRKGWIETFCSKNENSIFCAVRKDFIEDAFNLTGLNTQVCRYTPALKILLDQRIATPDMEEDARKLYGLIHSRFILTSFGMDTMLDKLISKDFEKCPRPSCEEQACLPVGFSDEPGVGKVNYFCPRCQQVYSSQKHSDLDGAYFGTTFAHLLVMTHPSVFSFPSDSLPSSNYVPRIFGFRIRCVEQRRLSIKALRSILESLVIWLLRNVKNYEPGWPRSELWNRTTWTLTTFTSLDIPCFCGRFVLRRKIKNEVDLFEGDTKFLSTFVTLLSKFNASPPTVYLSAFDYNENDTDPLRND